MKEFTKN